MFRGRREPSNVIGAGKVHPVVRAQILQLANQVKRMDCQTDSTSSGDRYTLRARDFHVPRSFLVCVLSLWLASSVALALDPNKRLTQYAHTSWRIEDGFLPSTPFWVSQTKDGYLWVGGRNGAWRFDGVRFTPWSPPIVKDFPSPEIRRFLAARAGGFWFGDGYEL